MDNSQQSQPVTDLIRTKRIEIVNDGRTRAVVGMLPNNNVGIGLTDTNGQLRLQLIVQEGLGTAFVLNDAEGRPRLQIALGQDGVAGMTLRYRNGQPHITLCMGPDETGALLFARDNDDIIWSAP